MHKKKTGGRYVDRSPDREMAQTSDDCTAASFLTPLKNSICVLGDQESNLGFGLMPT